MLSARSMNGSKSGRTTYETVSGIDERHATIPILLATASVHHHLIREQLRTRTSLVVDTAEAREINHFALLIGFGAEERPAAPRERLVRVR